MLQMDRPQDFTMLADERIQSVLRIALEHYGDPIQPGDILAAAILSEDADVLAVLSKCLRPGASTHDLMSIAEMATVSNNGTGNPAASLRTLGPKAKKCLMEFAEAWQGGVESDIQTPLLGFLECVFRHFGSEDRSRWAILDLDLLVRHLGGSHCQDSGEPRMQIPPHIAASEDLTERIRRSDRAGNPCDDTSDARYVAAQTYQAAIAATARSLFPRQGGHVLLTGDRGVGLTAVVVELASQAALGRIPHLRRHRILMVDCRYVAPEESRQKLSAILSQVGLQEDLVVCLDGLGALLRNDRGCTNKGLLISAVARLRCRLIGLLSPHEYEELIADDPLVVEFFSRVHVGEPDVESATKLLEQYAIGLSREHGVTIDADAVRRATVLTANYMLSERLPGKALRILNSVCEDLNYESIQSPGAREVTVDRVITAVAKASGIPEETLRGLGGGADYENSLRRHIVGQDSAVRQVATELNLIKTGLTDPGKPASVMLFVGPTGVGKTEMAKVLARFYSSSKRLKTYTLGNFIESHSVSGMIGVPPGYVGHEQGGRLINELNSDPYGVFLLDEADKTHPDVLQPFLNLFDEGWIRDQRGVTAFADKSIFILTTNVGQRMVADLARSGTSLDQIAEKVKEALSRTRHTKSNRPVFTPEFLARIRQIVLFQPLDRDAMEGICRRRIADMEATWEEKREKTIEVADELVKFIADEAHDVNKRSSDREGGRIVRRLVAELIDTPLQRAIATRPEEYQKSRGVRLGIQVGAVVNQPDAQTEGAQESSAQARTVRPEVTVHFGS